AQRYAKAFPSLGVPAVNNPIFIQGVLLEPDGQHVRPFWNWALPDGQHAIITVRLNRDASLDQVRQVVQIVRSAASSSDLKELHDLRFVVSGSPALTLSVADSVFNALRLLVPLALVAVLIVGLLALGTSMLLTHVVARRVLPSTGLAAAATAAGMLAFVVSGIPLVRQFGLFIAIGVAMAYLANYLVGLPALLLVGRRFPHVLRGGRIRAAAGRRIASMGALAPAAAIAIVIVGLWGWVALPAVKVETDPAQLVPAGDAALAEADAVRREVGLAGEIDLVLEGRDAASPD